MSRPEWLRLRRDKTKSYTLDDSKTELRQYTAFVLTGLFFGAQALMGGRKIGIIFWTLWLALNLVWLISAYKRYRKLPHRVLSERKVG